MSWLSENKFLAGFGAAMVVGVGALGYLTYSAMGKYESATEQYESTAAELKRLQGATPALTDANLKELLAQKQTLTEKIAAFQKELKARALPVEPKAPEAFQDVLKQTVARIVAKATEAHITLPKDFYLGFDNYRSTPPDAKAAPELARELRAIELVMNVLIDAGRGGNLELEELKRELLSTEHGKGKSNDAQPSGGKKRDDSASHGGPIQRETLLVKIGATDLALQKVLADLANQKQQLFVVRKLSIQNKQMESPPRAAGLGMPVIPVTPDPSSTPPADPATQAPAAPATPATPGAADAPAPAAQPAPAPAPAAAGEPSASPAPAGSTLNYVFGREKVSATLDIELLNFAEPEAKPEKGSKKKDK